MNCGCWYGDGTSLNDGGGSSGTNRVRKPFNEVPDSVRTSFTVPTKFIASGDFAEWVFFNGDVLTAGVDCDYVASESGGVGTGFDTITFNFVPMEDVDQLSIAIVPSGL